MLFHMMHLLHCRLTFIIYTLNILSIFLYRRSCNLSTTYGFHQHNLAPQLRVICLWIFFLLAGVAWYVRPYACLSSLHLFINPWGVAQNFLNKSFGIFWVYLVDFMFVCSNGWNLHFLFNYFHFDVIFFRLCLLNFSVC